jgi:hypothetical protein
MKCSKASILSLPPPCLGCPSEHDIAVVYLSNRVQLGRPSDDYDRVRMGGHRRRDLRTLASVPVLEVALDGPAMEKPFC